MGSKFCLTQKLKKVEVMVVFTSLVRIILFLGIICPVQAWAILPQPRTTCAGQRALAVCVQAKRQHHKRVVAQKFVENQAPITAPQVNPVVKNPIKKTLVIFVHGTVMPLLGRQVLFNFLQRNVSKNLLFGTLVHRDNSLYDELHGKLHEHWLSSRNEPKFHAQPLQALGLHPVPLIATENNAASFVAQQYRQNYHELHGVSDHLQFYTFGWIGMLSARARREAAAIFYKELTEERDRLLASGIDRLKIVVIAHSHGGNAVLHMAEEEERYKRGLLINKAIFMGTPVHKETEHLAHHPCFKKLYSLSSHEDQIQTKDYVSTGYWYCSDQFPVIADRTKRYSKMIQLKVTVNDLHPTHTEFWFCAQRESRTYRPEFPLHPLPLLLLIPHITKVSAPYLNHVDHAHCSINVNEAHGHIELFQPMLPQGKLRGSKPKKISLTTAPVPFLFSRARTLPWYEPAGIMTPA